jgi:thiol-disulfide isomerase/thioredoxin
MSRWTSIALRFSKNIVLGLLVLVTLWFVYRVTTRTLKSLLRPSTDNATKTPVEPTFDESDIITWDSPKGGLHTVTSDRTIDAILSGTFGPAVVLVYADWCGHCKNMMAAFEESAKKSTIVPFIKVQGHHIPVTARKHMIAGYPTIFGVASLPVGAPPRRYNGPRNADSFSEFASALVGTVVAPKAIEAAPVVAPVAQTLEAQQVVQASQVTQTEQAVVSSDVGTRVVEPTIQMVPIVNQTEGAQVEILN